MQPPQVTLSVVSHRQNALVNGLLADLGRLYGGAIRIIVTENVPDEVPLAPEPARGPVERIVNRRAQGFGANHNAAFKRCSTPLYCVANPDIRLPNDPLRALAHALESPRAAVAGPVVRSPAGAIEDSARRSPTLGTLFHKLFAGASGPDYPVDRGTVEVDWIAGMFMLFRRDAYAALGGFDEAYFLYYEDVDLCRRLRRHGEKVLYVPQAEVVHDARRASRRDPRLMRHHLAGIARYLRG